MTIYDQPARLLQTLIRFDTTNPPGNEAECIRYLDGLLQEAGLETTLLARDAERPNLLARLKGQGTAPPLLLQGHVDVVTTANQSWTYPPFSATEAEGCIWGRGALDMKSGVTMMVCALLRLQAEGLVPRGDVILCLLSDEEAGGDNGAAYLVHEHAEQFEGVRYAIGEFGGFPMYVGGAKFYPIQVAEKLRCSLRLTMRGPAGHGAMPICGGAMARLGRVLLDLDNKRTPIHVTPVTRMMIESLADAVRLPTSLVLRLLLKPRLTDRLIAGLGDRLRVMNTLFRNTVSPTVVRGGDEINVIPCQVTLDLDGRMLPGLAPEQIVAEVQAIVGRDVEIKVLGHDTPAPSQPDMSLFPLLAGILREMDRSATPIPYLQPAVTDARFFNRLGIQGYGFTPMNLPPDFNFQAIIHAADERIPVDSLNFGTAAMFEALRRYGS